MSAAAFAKGLLDLEGELTPILVCSYYGNISSWRLDRAAIHWIYCLQVSLVSKDSSMLDGLQDGSIEIDEAKVAFRYQCHNSYLWKKIFVWNFKSFCHKMSDLCRLVCTILSFLQKLQMVRLWSSHGWLMELECLQMLLTFSQIWYMH